MEFIPILSLPSQILRLALSLVSSKGMTSNPIERTKLTMTDFDVDFETGFVPRQPLPHLEKPFDLWENALEEAPDVLGLGDDDSDMAIERRVGGMAWRERVKSWPVLDIALLHGNRPHLQRAHMVVAWLVNFFVHSTPSLDGPIHVPRTLAVPLVQVSRMLGIAPVLTFADTVLWNWELIDPEKPTRYENVRITNLFTGTDDERNFYAVSVRAELEGAAVLHILEDYHNTWNISHTNSLSRVSRDLTKIEGLIVYLNEIIQSVRECCDPHVFYRDIRPWLEGSDSTQTGYPNWVYEGVDDWASLDLSGPSGGQSGVMHALDAFLGVNQRHHNGRPGETSEEQERDEGFMERMTRYMPGKHREYLKRLAAMPRPIRELAQRTPTLREPYNSAVKALKDLREKHMRVAFLYIITMSKSFPAKTSCPVLAMRKEKAPSAGVVLGTGGNDVARLLKACRDATRRTLLEEY